MPTIPSQLAGAPCATLSAWANNFAAGTPFLVATSHGALMLFPLCPNGGVFPGLATASSFNLGVSGAGTSVPHTLSASIGIYTLANSTQLSLLNSAGSTVGATNSAGTNLFLALGPRFLSLASSQWSQAPAFSQGAYWVGAHFQSRGASFALAFSGFRWMETQFSGHVGVGNTNSSASRPFPGMGVYSATFSSAMPSSLAFSDLRQAHSLAGAIPTIVINNIGA